MHNEEQAFPFRTGTSNTHSPALARGDQTWKTRCIRFQPGPISYIPGINLLSNAKVVAPLPRNRAIFGEIYPGDATVLDDTSKDIVYRWIRQGDYKLIVPS